jgi:hypothetical protein
MGLKNVLLLAGVAVSVASGLEFKTVQEHLQATKSKVKSDLATANKTTYDKIQAIRDDMVERGLTTLNLSSSSEELWDAQSALYDYLAEEAEKVYENPLDFYFSSSSDLYQYIDTRVSPWYDQFDEDKIYNDTFYDEVDEVSEELYVMVDNANDALYSAADQEFETLYDLMQKQDDELDRLDNVTEPVTTEDPKNYYDFNAEAQSAKIHKNEVKQRREKVRADARAKLAAAKAQKQPSSASSGSAIGAVLGSVAAIVIAYV